MVEQLKTSEEEALSSEYFFRKLVHILSAEPDDRAILIGHRDDGEFYTDMRIEMADIRRWANER